MRNELAGLEFEMPQCYGDLTFDQFFQLRDAEDHPLELLPILSGIPRRTWEMCRDLFVDEKVLPHMEWLKGKFDADSYLVPDFITISGKQYPKPQGIGINTYGQKVALELAINKAVAEGKTEIDLFPYVIALYMQPIIDKAPYNQSRVDELVKETMQCKLSEGWPIASFFLSSYSQLLKENVKNSLTHLAQKNKEQELMSLQSSESFRQFSLWRRLSIKALMMFYSQTTKRFSLPFTVRQKAVAIKGS
jgi:hypothetical protein